MYNELNHKQVRDCFHVINRKVFLTQKLSHWMAAHKCKSFLPNKRKLISSARNSFCLQNWLPENLDSPRTTTAFTLNIFTFSKALYCVERLFVKLYRFLVIIRFTQIPTFGWKNRLSFPKCVRLVNMSAWMDYNFKTT